MHIHKHYFHDKTILALLFTNTAMIIVAVLSVLLRTDPGESETFIVRYRENLGNSALSSGPLSEIQQFALFAVVIAVASTVLSMRIYGHRRHVATLLLGVTPFLLLLTIVVSDKLITHS